MKKESEEITIKNSVKTLKWLFRIVMSFKKLLLFVFILGGSIGFWKSINSKAIYTADIRYMLDNTSGGGQNSTLMGLANQFGLGGSSGGMTPEVLLSISQSRTILRNTLVEKSTIDGVLDFNLNHFIKKCGKDVDNQFYLTNPLEKDRTLKENSLIIQYVNEFEENNLRFSINKAGIITLEIKTSNENISKSFVDAMSLRIIDFFDKKTMSNKKNTYELMKLTVDSLKNELIIKGNHLTNEIDAAHSITKMKGRARLLNLKREQRIVEVLYAEAVKNLEVVRFDMLYNNPVIHIIDQPFLPLKPEEKSKVTYAVGVAFVGTFIVLFLIFTHLFYLKYWKEEK